MVAFVGRQTELSALRSLLADACAGRPRIALIRGEAGIVQRTQQVGRGGYIVERAGISAAGAVDAAIIDVPNGNAAAA